MQDLIDGKNTPLLDRCATCYACNEFCPTGANPFDRIAELQEEYQTAVPTDQAAAVLGRLNDLGLLGEAGAAALEARVSEAGRLAGVLEIDGDDVTILDVGPDPIQILVEGRLR